MYGRFFISLLLWISYSCYLLANPLDHRFQKAFQVQRLSLEQGLSQSVVNVMIQDSQGYIWVGTEDALNRFDGYDFTIYEHQHSNPKSLHDNFIYSLAEQKEKGIWVGTQNGLSFFDFKKQSFTNYQSLHEDLKTAITAIVVLPSGNLFIGSDNGLFIYNPKKQSTELFQSLQKQTIEDEITSITLIDSKIWISTETCVYSIHKEKNTIHNYCEEDELSQWLKGKSIKDIEIRHNSIWLGSNLGLARFDLTTKALELIGDNENSLQSLSSNWIQALDFDKAGNLWIGTSFGLNFYQYSESRFEYYLHKTHDSDGLSSNEILSLFIDNNGLVWVGTYAAGINILNPEKTEFQHILTKSDLAQFNISNTIHGISKDRDEYLWLASYGGGVLQFDLMTGEILRPFHKQMNEVNKNSNYAYSLHIDYKNRMWVGTSAGLFLFDLNEKKMIPTVFFDGEEEVKINDYILQIYEDHSNHLWIGTLSSLYKVEQIKNINKKTFVYLKNFQSDLPYSFIDRSSRVSTILETRDGHIWIGGTSGLLMYSQESEKWEHFEYHSEHSQSLSNDDVQVLFEDSRGTLWVGTANGLNKAIRNGDEVYFERITKEEGLPNNTIYGVLEDVHKQLWLSTNLGLVRYSAYTDSMQSFRSNDGLSSNEFNTGSYYVDNDGVIYFGSINGVTVVNSRTVRDKSVKRQLVFTEVKIGQRSLDLHQLNSELKPKIIKQQDESTIKISVADLYYHSLSTQSYRYRVLGLDDNWVYLGKERSFILTGLGEGEYYLDIQSKVGYEDWSETNLTLQLNVKADFFKSGKVYYFLFLFAFLFFIIILYFFRRYYKLKILKIENLIKVEEIRLKEAKKQNADLKLGLENKLNEINLMNEKISDTSKELENHQFRDVVSGFYRYQNISKMLTTAKLTNSQVDFNLIIVFHLNDLYMIDNKYGKICSAEVVNYVAIELRKKCPSGVHICALNDDAFIILGNSTVHKNLTNKLCHLRDKILQSKIPIANDRRIQANAAVTYVEIYQGKMKVLAEVIQLSDIVIFCHKKINLTNHAALMRVDLNHPIDFFINLNLEHELELNQLFNDNILTTHFLN